NGATRTWEGRIEKRLAEITTTYERRIEILRDALADFTSSELAERDQEIARLKAQIATLEQKLEQQASVDQRVHEITTRLEEKAARINEAKRGPTGRRGPSGFRGERGERGLPGASGKDPDFNKLTWHVDAKRYRVIPFVEAQPLKELDLRPLFSQYHDETSG